MPAYVAHTSQFFSYKVSLVTYAFAITFPISRLADKSQDFRALLENHIALAYLRSLRT